jgi:hypothetical protein
MKAKRSFRTLIAVLGMISGLVLLPAAAQAANVQCGDVLTQSVVLDHDLTGCNVGAPALVVAASNVTLDLSGHLVEGDIWVYTGPAIDLPFPGPNGLMNPVVENGTVYGSVLGINGHNVTIHGLDVTQRAGGGIVAQPAIQLSATGSVTDNRVTGKDAGIMATAGVVAHNTVTDSALGIGSTGPIHDNVVRNNATGIAGDGAVESNTVDHNRVVGITLPFHGGGGLSSVRHNSITDNGIGIYSNASPLPLLVTGNVISGNHEGIDFDDVEGIVEANRIFRNGIGMRGDYLPTMRIAVNAITGNSQVGLELGGFANSLLVEDNDLSGNGGDGLLVGATVSGSILQNRADSNQGDGIHIVPNASQADHQIISRNHAWFNSGWGIESIPGDSGSGNWTKHNGLGGCNGPVQCSTTGKPKG